MVEHESSDTRPRVSRSARERVREAFVSGYGREPDTFEEGVAGVVALAEEFLDGKNPPEPLAKKYGGILADVPVVIEHERMSTDLLQIMDDELPDSWTDSRLVCQRVQRVVCEFIDLGTQETLTPASESRQRTYDVTEENLRKREKEAMWKAREEGPGQDVTLSAVQNTCRRSLYEGIGVPSERFRADLQKIESRYHEEVPNGHA